MDSLATNFTVWRFIYITVYYINMQRGVLQVTIVDVISVESCICRTDDDQVLDGNQFFHDFPETVLVKLILNILVSECCPLELLSPSVLSVCPVWTHQDFNTSSTQLINTSLGCLAVADSEILRGRKTIYQSRCHLLQMHTTNYMPFIRGKGDLLKKDNGWRRTPPYESTTAV